MVAIQLFLFLNFVRNADIHVSFNKQNVKCKYNTLVLLKLCPLMKFIILKSVIFQKPQAVGYDKNKQTFKIREAQMKD